jgi:triosephosphate isomerase
LQVSVLRKPLVAGNWKMNLNLAAARALATEVRAGSSASLPVEVLICPPTIYLFPMAKAVADSPIKLGAQNCWHSTEGAFTGEVSPAMVKETGASYVILGHSERRHVIGPRSADGRTQGETDEMVAAKCRAVLAAGLTPIVCVGETLEERDAGQTETVLTRQIAGGLACLDVSAAARIVVAYEPVWAIGTGRNASAGQAQEAHAHIRGRLGGLFGTGPASEIRILYGGSVKASNAGELMAGPDVDGALVGGASLKSAEFLGIIAACAKAKRLS